MTHLEINANGSVERKILFGKKEKNGFYRVAPSSGVTHDGELYLFGVKKRGLSWVYALDDVVVRMKLK